MTGGPSLLVPTLAVFAATLAVLGCLMAAARGRATARLRGRIARAAGDGAGRRTPGDGPTIRLAEPGGAFLGVERLAARFMPRTSLLRERLARTGRAVPLGAYLSANLALGLLGAMLAGGLDGGLGAMVAGGIVVGAGVPHLAVSFAIRRRTKRFLAQFPDAIDLIVRGLRSGLPVTEQMAAVGAEMADPVGAEFRRIAHAVRFGKPLEDALWDASRRLDVADFKFFVVSLAVQRETGGNLAETLQNLSDVLRRRRQMRLKIKAMASEASASALILGSLPFLMLGILTVLNPNYIGLLFTDPRGQLMAGGALLLQAIGVLVMVKMVKFEI